MHLTSGLGTNIESRLLTELWRAIARRYGDVKFCEIRADMCIEGYPEKNCPTILAYRNGDIVKQVVTLRELRGQQTTEAGRFLEPLYACDAHCQDLEKLLVSVRAVEPNDHRVLHLGRESNEATSSIRSGMVKDDPDDDWD